MAVTDKPGKYKQYAVYSLAKTDCIKYKQYKAAIFPQLGTLAKN
jgi:hypothetical protein